MLAAMEMYFPEEVVWTRPSGGLFLWATLPAWMDAAELLKTAIEHKVAFVPGFAFQPDAANGAGKNTCRLNFSNANPEMITEGIKRLGKVITIAIEKHQAAELAPAD
jgi:DNA-binding transcriptional MocR family regulator